VHLNGWSFEKMGSSSRSKPSGPNVVPPMPGVGPSNSATPSTMGTATAGRTSVYEPLSNWIPTGKLGRVRSSIGGTAGVDEPEGAGGEGMDSDGLIKRRFRRRGLVGSVSMGRSRSNTVFGLDENGSPLDADGEGGRSGPARRPRSASSPVALSPSKLLAAFTTTSNGRKADQVGEGPESVRVSFIVKATPAGTLPASFVNMLALQLPSAVGKLAQYLTNFGFA
jgi:hypothetical protein